jgi:hypothetical protein
MGRKLDPRECLRKMAEPQEMGRACVFVGSDGRKMMATCPLYLIHPQELNRV